MLGNARRGWQPIRFVSAQTPPTLLLHGTDDTLVHPRETVDLAQRFLDAHVPVVCRLYAFRSHNDPVAALSLPLRLRREWAPGQATTFNGS
jgi:fermentation-respiration switch protein FrsA (DUF1100 family)